MGQSIGWSVSVVLVAMACDAPTPEPALPRLRGDAGAGGDASACLLCDGGIPLRPLPSDAGGAADSDVCEADAGAAPELRPGCPESAPTAGDCADEGLRCLYAAADENCRAEWECVYGIWSPRREQCPTELGVSENDSRCPDLGPIDGEPCSSGGLACGYALCSLGGPAVQAACRCGRWSVRELGCIEVP